MNPDKRDGMTTSPALDGHAQMEGQKSNSTPHKTPRKGKDKSADKEKLKEKQLSSPSSRPESRAVPQEPARPSWVLRIVSDQSEADVLEVKKDSEQADQIKAIKQAWESAEPGRSVKAQQARLKFINKYIQDVPTKEQNEDESHPAPVEETETETIPITPEVPAHVEKRQRWEPMDLTPYIRKTKPEPVLKDGTVILEQEMQKAEEIRQFRELREKMLEQREEEQKSRAILKSRILQMYEDLQVSLDASRDRILSARDSYRNKLLEAENEKQEALASQQAALQAELEAKGSVTKKGKDQKSADKSGKKKK